MKKGKLYSCALCQHPTGTLHEIVYGRTFRQMSIDCNLQIPLCDVRMCHNLAHREKEKHQRKFIEMHGLSYDDIIAAFNRLDKEYLASIAPHCAGVLEKYEY
jgi:hypothetical protein